MEKKWTVVASGLSYNATGLAANDVIWAEITSYDPCFTVTNVAVSNSITIVLTPTYMPTASISSNTNNACASYAKTFTVQGTNLGSSASYYWYLNGSYYSLTSTPTINIGTSAGTNSLVCTIYPSADACSGVSNFNTAVYTFTTNTAVTPSITITPTITNICAGVMQTFSANITNGGPSPAFQWQLNNVNITGANASTFSTNTLTGSPYIRVYATIDPNVYCVNNATPYSNNLFLTVNTTTAAPTITISTVGSNTYCAGSSKTFNANITNGGSTPSYQWKKNGANVGTNSSSYVGTGLITGDVITCDLTTNNICATSTLATSNSITVTVKPTSAPSVTIATNQGANFTVCQNAPLTFTANAVNTGTSNAYAWYVNSSLLTTTSTNTVSINTSVIGNKTIYCLFTPSGDACASPANATSNVLTYTVASNTNPSIAISSTLTNYSNYCSASAVVVTSTVTNGGANPTYLWQVNNVTVGTNSPTLALSGYTSNPSVYCYVTTASLNACATTMSATSNNLYYYYNQSYPTPTISITSSTSNSVCAGTSKLFSATTSFGGTYQWKKNGVNVSTGSAYNASGLVTGDLISCDLTSTYPCFTTTNVASSNTLSIIVTPSVTPYVTVASPTLTVCQPNFVTYTVSNVAGGTTPTYQWYLNGNLYTTSTATTVSIPWATLGSNHVYAKMTVASDACALTNTATSNVVSYTTLANANPTIAIVTPTNNICEGTPISFTANIGNGGASPLYNGTLILY